MLRVAEVSVACLVGLCTGCAETVEQPLIGSAEPIAVPDDLPLWNVVEELRIGSADDPDTSLSDVNPQLLAVASDGTIYVGQRQAGEIRAFDATGSLERTIGRQGQGPGEFVMLLAIGIVNDELYGSDFGAAEMEFFSLDGVHLRTHSYRTASHGGRPTPPYVLFPDGSGVVSPSGGVDDSMTYFRLAADGSVLDTLITFPVASVSLTVPLPRGTLHLIQPFGRPPPMATDLAGENWWVVEAPGFEEFRVIRRDGEGATVYDRRYQSAPIEVPDNVRDSIESSFLERMERFGPTRTDIDAALQLLDIPTHYRPVDLIIPGEDGSLWLARARPYGSLSRRWELHSDDGIPLAALELPVSVQVALFGAGMVWGVDQDELGVPYVVRYRIEAP